MHKIFEFLFSLEQVKLDDMSRVRLTFDYPNWVALILAALVVLGCLGYWSYMGQSAAPGKRAVMGILRGLTLMTLLGLCLRPHLVLEESKSEPSVIALWIDDSATMAIRDPYKDPAQRARAQNLMEKLKAASAQPIKEKWPMRWDMAIDTALKDKGLHELLGTPRAVATTMPAAPTIMVEWGKLIGFGVVYLVLLIGVIAYLFSSAGKKLATGTRVVTGFGTFAALSIVMIVLAMGCVDFSGGKIPDQVTQEVVVFTGHDEAIAQGRATTPDQLDAILNRIKDTKPVGVRTDIPKIVTRIFNDLQGQPVSSIIMLTDGVSSAGTDLKIADATGMAKSHQTPVISYPIGSQEALVNAAITRMDVSEDVFVKDPVLVKVGLKITSDVAGTTHVTLYLRPAGATDDKKDTVMKGSDGKDVSAAVEYVKGTKDYDAELIFKPLTIEGKKSEVYHLVAKVDSIGEELSEADNVREAQTTVMDTRVNVLYVEGYPRWEYRYLKNELLREGTINVSVLLLSADDTFAQEGTTRKNPDGTEERWTIQRFPETEEEMLKYDVILLGDVEPDFFSPTQMKLMLDFVKKHGGGIGWIAGEQYNPDSYKGTALLPLLPIDPDDPQHRSLPQPNNTEFKVKATPEGFNTPLFRFFDDPEQNKTQMANNPPMYWYKPVLGTHGPVQVLAEHPVDQVGGQKMPLVVYGQYGDGRVLFSGIADTWRWRYYKGEPLYQSYWLQVCRMLYAGRIMGQNHKVQLQANGRTATVNQPMPLTVTIHDPTMLPGAPAQLIVQVTDDAGNPLEPVTLSRVGENGNTYTGELTSFTMGKLHLQVAPGSLSVDPTPMDLDVGVPNDVDGFSTVNMEALTTFASETGGKVLNIGQAGDLVKLVANKSRMIIKPVGEDLWTKPFALVIMVLLLTGEWLMRKQSGLI